MTYNVYSNDGMGGPIDYDTPITNTTALTFTVGPLNAPSDNLFAVRAFDPNTNLEEYNTDARVRIVIDSTGKDVTARPKAPHALFARAVSRTGCRLAWAYNPVAQGGAPDGFYVYVTAGATPSYDVPAQSIAYKQDTIGYSCQLNGLAPGTAYTLAVRAFNAVAIENNTTVRVPIQTNETIANPVDFLTAVSH